MCPSVSGRYNLQVMKLDIQQRFLNSVQRAAWFLLTALYKMCKEREELKKESLGEMEQELTDLKNSQPIHILKSEKVCLEDKTGECGWTITS